MSVTPRAVQAIYTRPNDGSLRPVLQILSASTLAGQPGRFKVVLSDGENYTTGLLSSQLVTRLGGCPFKQNQLIGMEEYLVNTVQDKVFIVIHQVRDIPSPPQMGQIGNPQAYRPNLSALAPSVSPAMTTGTALAQPPAPRAVENPNYTNPYSSLPSHSPFAAGMAQSMPPQPVVDMNPPSNRTAGPVRYLKPSGDPAVPMSQLTIYTQKWTIKARVATKSDLRTFRNARGEGQLMTIELVDAQQSEMRATFFGSAALKFHPMLQVGSVYTFSKGSVKPANPRFNPKAQYELMFDEHSEIVPIGNDDSIPAMKLNMVPIATLQNMPVGDTVDVAGIVVSIGDLVSVTVKSSGRDTAKRSIILADDSGSSIDLTIWGEKAERINAYPGSAVVAKGCRLGDYNGRSLSTSGSSLVEVDPHNTPRAVELKTWWSNGGSRIQFNPLTNASGSGSMVPNAGMGGKSTTIQAMRQEDINTLSTTGGGRSVNFHTVKATVVHIPLRDSTAGAPSLYYRSCATEVDDGRGGRRMCQKKTEQQGDVFVCAEQHMNRSANARFILSMRIQDPSGECLVRAFHDEARHVLGNMDASEIDAAPDPVMAQQTAVDKALFKQFIFKVRSKKEVHMDEERLNLIVSSATPVDPAGEARSMLGKIKAAGLL